MAQRRYERIGEGPDEADGDATLKQAALEWLDACERGEVLSRKRIAYKPSTLRSYRADLELHVYDDLAAANCQPSWAAPQPTRIPAIRNTRVPSAVARPAERRPRLLEYELEGEDALQVRRVRELVYTTFGVRRVVSIVSHRSRRRSKLIAMPLVIRLVLSIVSHRSHQRFELIAMPLVNRQLPKLVDGKPARLQPLRELRHVGERQLQRRYNRRLCLDPNLDLGLAVGAGGGHRR